MRFHIDRDRAGLQIERALLVGMRDRAPAHRAARRRPSPVLYAAISPTIGADRHAVRAGDDRRADDAGARPQMRRQAAGDAEADNPRAAAHQRTCFRDRRRKLGRQVAAVPAANDMHTGSGGDARFKCQSDDDNHVAPASPLAMPAKTSRDPAGSFFADRLHDRDVPLYRISLWSRLAAGPCPCRSVRSPRC